MMDATALSDKREEMKCPPLSNPRKTAASVIPEASSHARYARTGHVRSSEPSGMLTIRPSPSWSVFERRSIMRSPPLHS